MKVKSHFHNVDQIMVKIKAATVKNKTRQTPVGALGYSPQLVVTR